MPDTSEAETDLLGQDGRMGIACGTDHASANDIPFFLRRTSVNPHSAVKQQQRQMKKRVEA